MVFRLFGATATIVPASPPTATTALGGGEREYQRLSNLPPLISPTNAFHWGGVTTRTAPSRSLLSRTAAAPFRSATSTQLPLARLCELFRQRAPDISGAPGAFPHGNDLPPRSSRDSLVPFLSILVCLLTLCACKTTKRAGGSFGVKKLKIRRSPSYRGPAVPAELPSRSGSSSTEVTVLPVDRLRMAFSRGLLRSLFVNGALHSVKRPACPGSGCQLAGIRQIRPRCRSSVRPAMACPPPGPAQPDPGAAPAQAAAAPARPPLRCPGPRCAAQAAVARLRSRSPAQRAGSA
jgi:hypothetical protein